MNKDYCELWVTQNNPRTKYRGGKQHAGSPLKYKYQQTLMKSVLPSYIFHPISLLYTREMTKRGEILTFSASEHQYASANAHTKNTSSCCFTCSPTGTCPHKGELLHTEGPWESGRPISASLWITHAYSIGSVLIFLSTTSASGLHNFRGCAEALVSEWVCLCLWMRAGRWVMSVYCVNERAGRSVCMCAGWGGFLADSEGKKINSSCKLHHEEHECQA